jgi:hypothetical protein
MLQRALFAPPNVNFVEHSGKKRAAIMGEHQDPISSSSQSHGNKIT